MKSNSSPRLAEVPRSSVVSQPPWTTIARDCETKPLVGEICNFDPFTISPIKAGISLTFCFSWNNRQGLTKCAHKRVLKTGMKLYQRHSSCKCCKCKATWAQIEIASKVLVQIQIWQQSAAPLLPSSPPWTIDSSIVSGQCFCDVHQS